MITEGMRENWERERGGENERHLRKCAIILFKEIVF